MIIFDLTLVPGPGVPASCIQSRVKALRKKAAGLGITPQPSPAAGSKRPAGYASTNASKKAKINENTKVIEEDKSQTPPAATKKGTKAATRKVAKSKTTAPKTLAARVLARKTTKKNVKAAEDALVKMENAADSNGDKDSGNDLSEHEDSYDGSDIKSDDIKDDEEVEV